MYITSCAKKSSAAAGPTDHVSHVALSQHLLSMVWRRIVLCTAMHSVLKNLFFLFLSFLMISRRQIISRSAEPIFAIFTLNESFLAIDDRSGLLFSISQGMLPWQPILCKKMANSPLCVRQIDRQTDTRRRHLPHSVAR